MSNEIAIVNTCPCGMKQSTMSSGRLAEVPHRTSKSSTPTGPAPSGREPDEPPVGVCVFILRRVAHTGEPEDTVIATEQLHVGPVDDAIEHVMSAFCPCFPALEVELTDCGHVQIITYRHNVVGESTQ